jgi:hypothetical protein
MQHWKMQRERCQLLAVWQLLLAARVAPAAATARDLNSWQQQQQQI